MKILITSLGTGMNGKERNILSILNHAGYQDFYAQLKEKQYPDKLISMLQECRDENEVRKNLHSCVMLYGLKYQNQAYQYTYDETQYQFASGFRITTPYITEALAVESNAEKVIVVGTATASWDGFYQRFAAHADEETLKELLAIKEAGSIHTRGESLKDAQKKLQEILQNSELKQEHAGRKMIPVLVRYGIDQEQLNDNYEILSEAFKEAFQGKQSYEVSVDITHSFRSLSIYDLSILNYLQNIEDADVRISHIYYGCQEVRNEYIVDGRKTAPVVDLADDSRMQSMSNALALFKTTGLTEGLIDNLDDYRKPLQAALAETGRVVELNNLSMIAPAFSDLYNALQGYASFDQHEYALLEDSMLAFIKEVFLRAAVPAEKNQEDLEEAHIWHIACMQLDLVQWFMHNGRYGLACLTADAALDSFLSGPFVKYERRMLGEPLYLTEEQQWYSDKTRPQKIERLRECWERDPDQKLMKGLYDDYQFFHSMRIGYAHNLARVEGEISFDGREEIKRLEGFIQHIQELERALSDPSGAFFNAYCLIDRKELAGEDLPMILNLDKDDNLPEKNGWLLPVKSCVCIIRKNKQEMKGYLLLKYLEHWFGKEKDMEIHIHGSNLYQLLYFRTLLMEHGYDNVHIYGRNGKELKIDGIPFEADLDVKDAESEETERNSIISNHLLDEKPERLQV